MKLSINFILLININYLYHFTYLGDVYLCGDFNSRTGSLSDFVEATGLDRFVDLPASDEQSGYIPPRQSCDSVINAFGHKLISLCKEHDLKILNGRLEPGRFTFMSHGGWSVVDYFISQTSNYSKILKLNINDLSEFSDHCIIEMTFAFEFQTKCEIP